MSDNLSQWISSEVKKRGWTLRYAARRAEISHATMARIANGEVPKPTPRICARIAAAFGIPLEQVYRMAGMLPPREPALTERRMRYRVGSYTMTERVVELFERLGAEQQELVIRLLETLAEGTPPRIIGDAPEEGIED